MGQGVWRKYLKLLAFLPFGRDGYTDLPIWHTYAGVLLNEYHRWILWVPVFLGIGVGVYFSLKFEPAWYAAPAILTLCLIIIWKYKARKLIVFLSLAGAVLAAGFIAAELRTLSVAHTVLDKEHGPARITGQVSSVETRPRGLRLTIDNPVVRWLEAFETPQRIRININTSTGEDILPGDWVRVYAVLRPPQEPATPHAFDFQRYAYFKEIGATGFSYGAAEVIHQSKSMPIPSMLEHLRVTIGNKIRERLTGTTGAIAAALITGDRGAIPEATVDAMRDAGLAHLLAISGLHIGLVAGFVFFCVRAILALIPPIALRYPIKSWAAVIALCAALSYTLISGATVPTLRAFAMMALVLGAVMIGRRGISMRLVAWAATVILLLRPESLFGASFQLSFAAVTGLIAAYEYLNQRFSGLWRTSGMIRRLALYACGVGFSTVVASVSTAPFAAFHFHQLASYGLLSNLVAVPLTAMWVMPSALLGIVLMPFGMDSLGLVPMGWGIDIVVSVAETVAPLPGNVKLIPQFSMTALLTFVAGGLWLCLWSRAWRLLGIVAVSAALVIAANPRQPIVIVAPNGELFGISMNDTLAIVGPGANGNRFTQRVWFERAGLKNSPFRNPPPDDHGLRCDLQGCALTTYESSIALIWEESALLEDCWRSDVIISAVPVRMNCAGPSVVIDRFDLWRDGAHAIYINGDTLEIENTFQTRGTRPWTGNRKGANNDQS